MIIGNQKIFAFEINECVPRSPILKDVFMWIDNKRVGHEAPYFSTYCSFAESFLNNLKNKILRFNELENETAIAAFNLLNSILENDLEYRFLNYKHVYDNLKMVNWDDALDGWDIFVFEKDEYYRIIWSPFESSEIFSKDIEKQYFISTFTEFIKYSKTIVDF